ncbi:hypothetical protein [Acetilactobacillus jinshanensis]|uniref:Uncharacterized protein n=1 Tax=Acetilactobacillus jinshanensis TaxID=1720083 RepID=A0A4P6ZKY1_9LACO|nr:hypothetical protein [Acetilactobacillus jinshanensis]QBP18187.1 hypothetical protein ELX58_03335 [Acetilactobacillus jinshanensis]URL61054.1 hypothetical protein HGK75_03395 [uncultured bacterium]
MRINKKRFKQQKHANQIKLPHVIVQKFAKAIAIGNVPSNQQLKIAVDLGVVKKNASGKLDPKSLNDYFTTFIQQRHADDARNQNQ